VGAIKVPAVKHRPDFSMQEGDDIGAANDKTMAHIRQRLYVGVDAGNCAFAAFYLSILGKRHLLLR
jgi:hypothetical protein